MKRDRGLTCTSRQQFPKL